MSAEYEDDHFESESADEKKHLLKLSIDFLSVKDFKMAASVCISYALKLTQSHSFKSSPPTPVKEGPTEVKLQNSFASYDFQASKTELFSLLNDSQLQVKVIHQEKTGSSVDYGIATVEMKEILQAPLKKTPQAVVRVSDQYLPIKEGPTIKGIIRCILYLQDMGEVIGQPATRPQPIGQENKNPNEQSSSTEYQTLWQLEMWKRSEEQKFKAYLKQKEIERIEEITYHWKNKEQEREKTFIDALAKVNNIEQKLRQKALDLQRREERIIQLEEELKHKISEVSRQLTIKEEEIMTVKKRFKEERVSLEADKKKLTTQLEESKARLETTETKLYQLKREVDESPLSLLRSEIAQKNLELVESESRNKRLEEERDDCKRRFEQLKREMINLKKQIDSEKQQTLQRQGEELEKLKNEMRNKQAQDEERRELMTLKQQLASLTQKMSESQKQMQAPQTVQSKPPETINDRAASYNPFYNQNTQQSAPNIFLDNYARSQASPVKEQTYGAVSHGISMTSEVDRLLREKNDLLKTGCYIQDDPLIIELDRQIRAHQLRIQ